MSRWLLVLDVPALYPCGILKLIRLVDKKRGAVRGNAPTRQNASNRWPARKECNWLGVTANEGLPTL